MTIRVALEHHTEYLYDRPVSLSPHVIRLRPAPHCRTPILSYSLKVEPRPHFVNWHQDPFGNYLARFVFPEQTRRFCIEVSVVADMTVINPFDFFLDDDARTFPFAYDEQLAHDLAPYLKVRERGARLLKWLEGVDRSAQGTVDFLVALNMRVHRDVGYVIRMEPGVQSCERTLALGRGSCRDSAWLLVQIARHLGLAARFVSGYLVQLTADQKALDGPSGPEADFTDLHAWAEIYVPGAGWIGLDATSGLFAGEGHIPLACTPDPASAAPVTGAVSKAETEFVFHNRVRRIHEDPRVTRPYSDEQWAAIDALGEHIDEELLANDVRLSMGGEPTFVSVDDMDGAQWNTEALGEHKRRLAGELLLRLKALYAPGGVLTYGQGKWYPGEQLPRWALSCAWREDGEPLWRDAQWLADETRDYGYDHSHARTLIERLVALLGVDAGRIVAAYEDVYYYLWREGNLPANVDAFDSKLDDPIERARLRRVFEAGLDQVAGYTVPLAWGGDGEDGQGQGGWRSSAWPVRRERLYLIPGDSPMGLRLPLHTLPHSSPEDRQHEVERDPFEPRGALPPYRVPPAATARSSASARRASRKVAAEESPLVRTSLCVEPRGGRLYVFLPPQTRLESYIELLACVEAAARECGLPVVIEGYDAPHDPRLRKLSVTPDPGVIEVNVQPAWRWGEVRDIVTRLYEQARLTRLGTEKFMLDGRHTGTGGGNHITLGGRTPADSPMLRRPSLLRSLIAYWQNHPSLSYLFSGTFIGPTSQAPRVDEARDDNLYELEIALQQLPEGDCQQPWLIDRALRNLLVDLTGNTHRAEFCIDKLYSPDSSRGRLGLVEFRGFEMPPHPRMSLVQILLLRSLVARFWNRPYTGRLVRWGTGLHDRFMLPHYVWADFKDVIADQRAAGHALELAWFAPFHEFRFPHYGRIVRDDIEVELRAALEPWHVLGEEASGGGTARYVDSSLERVQVKVSGMVGERHVVTCNGRRVPLHPTGTHGEFVAGVRYKAWQPWSALHPAIAAHVPLVFDLIDTWNGRSIGGCTYHVAHPGGRSYDTFPVNANEAEARRIARFSEHGHTGGAVAAPAEERNPDHPHTLDLRRAARPG